MSAAITSTLPHVAVCVCTYRRPELLRRLLETLARQRTEGRLTFSVVVADNDRDASASATVDGVRDRVGYAIEYGVEPQQGIAQARNRAVAMSRGDYVAFIDDDEYPVDTWLLDLWRTREATGADGVLGPVIPDFDVSPPAWIVRGGFHMRPTHSTGQRIGLRDARTGNVLLDRALFAGDAEPFRHEFATGGEDVDFFRRMMAAGRVFVWCAEAAVMEVVPAARCTQRYLVSRALMRGRNNARQRAGLGARVCKALVAVPAYALVFPFARLTGRHRGVKILVKLCDHAGLLLALAGVNPVRERA